MDNKFKVDDIIIGNERNTYAITNKSYKCKVEKVVDNQQIEVSVLEGRHRGGRHLVRSAMFDLVKEEKVIEYKREETEKCSIEYDEKLDVTFIHMGDVTIAIPLRADKIATTVKHPKDVQNKEIAKSLAYYRLRKGVIK